MICLPKQYLKTMVEIFGLPKGMTAEKYFYYWSHWQTEFDWHHNKYVFDFKNFQLHYQGLIPFEHYQCYADSNSDLIKYDFDLGLN